MSDSQTAAPAAAAPEAAPQVDNSQEASAKPEANSEGSKKETAAEKKARKLSLKVDGKEEIVDLDALLSNEEELKKELQLSRAAKRRMQEAAEIKKEREQLDAELKEFFNVLRTDPRKILSDPSIGVDIKKLAEQIMNEELERAAKDPKELELEEAKKKLEALEKERKEEKDKLEKERFEALVNQNAAKLETDIMTALQDNSIPNNPLIISRIAQYMELALHNDVDVPVKEIIPIVMGEIQNDVKEMVKHLKPDQVKALFGDVVDGMRKEDIKKIKDITNLNAIKDVGQTPPEKKEEKKMSIKQWMKGGSLT